MSHQGIARMRAAVVTVSDKGYAGIRADTAGPTLCALLREAEQRCRIPSWCRTNRLRSNHYCVGCATLVSTIWS